MYNRKIPQNCPSTYEVGASRHNFQFNTVKEVSNPTFEPRKSSIEGYGRQFIGPNRQTGNADYTNQILVSTQPLPNVGWFDEVVFLFLLADSSLSHLGFIWFVHLLQFGLFTMLMMKKFYSV